MTGTTVSDSKLVSLGCDGRIFVWEFSLTEGSDFFSPCRAFAVSTTDLGRTFHAGKTSTRSEVGIASASFCDDEDQEEIVFVIGCFGGAVLRCHVNQESSHDLGFDSPVGLAYAPHRSSITSVQFSPRERNLFLSASEDGEIRVFKSLDSKPVALLHLSLEKSAPCVWSHEGLVIFFLSSGGLLRSIALSPDHSRLYHCTTPFLAQELEEQEVSSFWLNDYESRADELAVLSSRGDLCVWRLRV